MNKGIGKYKEKRNEEDTKDKDGTYLLLELTKNNNNKNLNAKKSKTIVQQPKGRDNLVLNDINNDNNYSLSSENEEEEFNSDEYISSTMLDVETNTYIEPIEKNTNNCILNINDKDINKSLTKTKEAKNVKSYFIKYINNDIDYLNKNRNDRMNSKEKEKRNKIKNDNNNYSSSKKINKNDKSKDILFKKLKIKNINNNNDRDEEKVQKKKLKIVEKENKNYSMMGCKSPLNIIYSKDNSLKLDNININFLSLIKSHNSSKKGNKKIKNDINNIKININEKNKSIKHNRTPTMINNKNINIKDLIIKQQYTKICDNKNKRKNLFSPKYNKKLCINSMKIINSLNTINNKETLSSSLNNINNESQNLLIHFSNNNNYLIKSNNTINLNNNNNINKTINSSAISNNNKNNINHTLFSPLKNKLDINLNRNTSPVYNHNPFNSNSISIENNHNISNNKFDSNRISDKLLTYSFQDQKLLSRNKTFKNKRLHNNNKFFNLLLNKKKMNFINSKNINEQKKNSQSPKTILNLNNLKKMTDNIIKRNNHIKIGIQKIKNNNGSNNVSKNSYLNSYSNRKQYEQNYFNKNNIYIRDKKFHSKQFIYIKKENISNIVKLPNKNIHETNPFNQDSKNTSKVNSKNLSLSKSNKRYINTGNSEIKDKSFNINLTSINLIKNAIKNKKIKLEIGRKKKTKYRAKTLMEQDFLRDVLINNKDMNLKDYSNNKSAYNMSLNSINYNSLNNRQQERSTNYSPSIKEIMKNPTQKQDINFNININMNNNNYKKLIYHYHGHNNSSINNSYVNKNERNSHLSFNPIMKKRDIFGKEKEFYKKRNSNDINSNELKLNKNHEINNKDGSKYNSCFLNGNEFNNINSLNGFNNIYSNIIPNCNNYIEEYYINSSSLVNKYKNNIHNSNISKNIIKQHFKNESKKNKYSKINIKDNHKKENNKNKIKNNIKKKKEYLPLDINNTLSNSDFEQNKIAYNSKFNIQLSNNDSGVNNCFKINSPKNCIDINNNNSQKVKKDNIYIENGNKIINEMNEFYNDNYEDNLDKLDNYICNYYYSTNSNKNDN